EMSPSLMIKVNRNLFITDRIKEFIKYKGFQVAPAELEEILITHPAVSDAAVVGFYCEPEATEYPLGYVTLRAGYEQSSELIHEIKKYIADRVAPHKRLRDVIYIDKIPKSAAGKLLRRLLKEKAKAEISEDFEDFKQLSSVKNLVPVLIISVGLPAYHAVMDAFATNGQNKRRDENSRCLPLHNRR
ncbi:10506_t:CDS:2, partial [Acaulospora morrowiae]